LDFIRKSKNFQIGIGGIKIIKAVIFQVLENQFTIDIQTNIEIWYPSMSLRE
jgi:hypothetical protein